MKKLTDIVEVAKLMHPNALHVSPVKVDGQTKYKVKAVGKNLADGIKVGEHLTDTHLDDAAEMGAKIKHIKEDVELDEAIKIGSKVKVHAPGKDYHGEVGHVGEIRHGAYKGAPKTYTVDYSDSKSVQLGKDSIKSIKEEAEQIDEISTGKLADYVAAASRDVGRRIEKAEPGIEPFKKVLKRSGKIGRALGAIKYKAKQGVKEEVEPEADMNILVQLRKPIDILEHGTQGGADIVFGDGQKLFVEGTVAKKLVESMEQLKPEDRVKVAEFLYQSHDNMMSVFARLK
jgi:ribosomal protein L21E